MNAILSPKRMNDGIIRGEGCGVVILRPLETARTNGDRVYAVVLASDINNNRYISIYYPNNFLYLNFNCYYYNYYSGFKSQTTEMNPCMLAC